MAPSATSSSGIGIANLPNQRHKIVTQRGANFTLMVCGMYQLFFFSKPCYFVTGTYSFLDIMLIFLCNQGESGVGKTTFVNTLFTTGIKEHKNHIKRHSEQLDKTVKIEITKAGNFLTTNIKLTFFYVTH
jgi:cell division control protein 12